MTCRWNLETYCMYVAAAQAWTCTRMQTEPTHSTNMPTNHISRSSTPLSPSGGREAEGWREKGKNDVGPEHQTINSPLSLCVFGGEGGGEEGGEE